MPPRKKTAPATTPRPRAQPAAREAAGRKPAARKPAARKPAARKPAARKPAARKPVSARTADPLSRERARKILDRGMSKADMLKESALKWVVKLALRAKALYDMLSAWWHGKYDFPAGTLSAIGVALLYFLSPFDLVPDILPLFGLMDDAAVLAFVVHKTREDLEAYASFLGKSPADLGL